MADDTNTLEPTAPGDSTPYIRTYAKDVALLTGKQAPVGSARRAPKDQPQPGVLLPETDPSPVHSNEAVSPKEYKPEVLATSKEDEQGVISSRTPVSQETSVFSSIPHAPISITPNVPQPSVEEREAILTRLRAKAAAATPPAPEPEKPVALPPTPPPVMPIPVAPQFTAPVEPVPGIPPVSKESYAFPEFVAPAAPDTTATATPAENLHTYKTDFADRIDQEKASTFSVLAAQSDAVPAPAQKQKRNWGPIIAGAILIVGGFGIAGGVYYFFSQLPKTQTILAVPSLLTPDETVELKGSGPVLMQALADLAAQPSIDGNIIVTYVTTSTTTKKGLIATPQPGGTLIQALALSAPDILLRNLDPLSTVGVVDAGADTKPFFILRVTSYERTFAGMLSWEKTIGNDLSVLYPQYVPPALIPDTASTASTTATTTAKVKKTVVPVAPVVISEPRFSDAVVANHDVRILKDGTGHTILLYGYRDKQTLIIARDDAAFAALIDRLSATRN